MGDIEQELNVLASPRTGQPSSSRPGLGGAHRRFTVDGEATLAHAGRLSQSPTGMRGIWTRDVDRPLRVDRELQAGTVWVNDWAALRDEFDDAGFKQSGRGRLRTTSSSTSTSSSGVVEGQEARP